MTLKTKFMRLKSFMAKQNKINTSVVQPLTRQPSSESLLEYLTTRIHNFNLTNPGPLYPLEEYGWSCWVRFLVPCPDSHSNHYQLRGCEEMHVESPYKAEAIVLHCDCPKNDPSPFHRHVFKYSDLRFPPLSYDLTSDILHSSAHVTVRSALSTNESQQILTPTPSLIEASLEMSGGINKSDEFDRLFRSSHSTLQSDEPAPSIPESGDQTLQPQRLTVRIFFTLATRFLNSTLASMVGRSTRSTSTYPSINPSHSVHLHFYHPGQTIPVVFYFRQ